MEIKIPPDLEAALKDHAARQKLDPVTVALNALRARYMPPKPPFEPRDEWERDLFSAAIDCGVSLSNEAVSSEGIYD